MQAKLFVLLALIVCALIIFLIAHSSVSREREEVARGVQYLNKIDSKEALAKAEKTIKEQRADAMAKLITEAAKDGNSSFDPWSYFNDSVIMGDSRAVGFYVFEYLPKSRVLADAGNTIMTIEDSMDTLRSLNPSYIFLCYGLNDITSGRWASAEDWINEYSADIQNLKDNFPDTKIVVNSILPTDDRALATNERVKLVPEYEQALKEYCTKNNVTFVDCDKLAENHKDLIVDDGIHYHVSFYPYWAAEMIMTAYMGDDEQLPEDTEG